MTTSTEDLEERIARIKKRNEEIEKKHREAEADRLMALKENAMVAIKPPKDDDWPREHKYDKLDFTYDVDKEKLAEQAELDGKSIYGTKRIYNNLMNIVHRKTKGTFIVSKIGQRS
jgi:hypothetical protein